MVWEIVACFFGFVAGWCGRYWYWQLMDRRERNKAKSLIVPGSDEDFADMYEKEADHEHQMMLQFIKSRQPGLAERSRDAEKGFRLKAAEYRAKTLPPLKEGVYR